MVASAGPPAVITSTFWLAWKAPMNAPTKLMKELGYGREYRYAHDEPDAYAADEHYFPEGMPEMNWYRPTPRGLEARIAEKLAYLRELDKKAKKS